MGTEALSRRDIIGGYYARLEQGPTGWVGEVANYFPSDQASEIYKWLGQTPQMREWTGGRHAKGLRSDGVTIFNTTYESTLSVDGDDWRRDKTAQIQLRVNEQVTRSNTHWASLLSGLILGGETGVCYDGQYFFDTDHTEGDSGTQSNKISIDISALPVTNHGTTTAPSVGEMQQAILRMIQQMYGFKDDQGEPINEEAMSFLVMVPTSFWHVANAAVAVPMIDSGESNVLPDMPGLNIRVRANPRLTWTDKLAAFRTDGDVKSFITQAEEDASARQVLDENSEHYFKNNELLFGLKESRGFGYGRWQGAVLGQLT